MQKKTKTKQTSALFLFNHTSLRKLMCLNMFLCISLFELKASRISNRDFYFNEYIGVYPSKTVYFENRLRGLWLAPWYWLVWGIWNMLPFSNSVFIGSFQIRKIIQCCFSLIMLVFAQWIILQWDCPKFFKMWWMIWELQSAPQRHTGQLLNGISWLTYGRPCLWLWRKGT